MKCPKTPDVNPEAEERDPEAVRPATKTRPLRRMRRQFTFHAAS